MNAREQALDCFKKKLQLNSRYDYNNEITLEHVKEGLPDLSKEHFCEDCYPCQKYKVHVDHGSTEEVASTIQLVSFSETKAWVQIKDKTYFVEEVDVREEA